jgi:hypothetical protein
MGLEYHSRFGSIEPVALQAGNFYDSYNEHAAGEFIQALLNDHPEINIDWFSHFETFFGLGMNCRSALAHQIQFFLGI